jgi:hypothetical protein
MKGKKLTAVESEQIISATSEAIAVLAGLLAEAAGSGKLAYHFGAALDAQNKANPDPLRDRMLRPAYRLVLTKARIAHPDDPVLESLAASELGSQRKH